MKELDPRIGLVLAVSARLHQLFDEIPKENDRMRGLVLSVGAHVLDYTKPDTSIVTIKPEKGEGSVAYLIRAADRIRMLPRYRWPSLKFPVEAIPQMLFGPLQATKTLLAGEPLPPREVLEFTGWLQPVWEQYPTLKGPVMRLTTAFPSEQNEKVPD